MITDSAGVLVVSLSPSDGERVGVSGFVTGPRQLESFSIQTQPRFHFHSSPEIEPSLSVCPRQDSRALHIRRRRNEPDRLSRLSDRQLFAPQREYRMFVSATRHCSNSQPMSSDVLDRPGGRTKTTFARGATADP